MSLREQAGRHRPGCAGGDGHARLEDFLRTLSGQLMSAMGRKRTWQAVALLPLPMFHHQVARHGCQEVRKYRGTFKYGCNCSLGGRAVICPQWVISGAAPWRVPL